MKGLSLKAAIKKSKRKPSGIYDASKEVMSSQVDTSRPLMSSQADTSKPLNSSTVDAAISVAKKDKNKPWEGKDAVRLEDGKVEYFKSKKYKKKGLTGE